jgi:hypothetical protein
MSDDALADLMFADFTQTGVAEPAANNAEASPTAQATEAVSTPAETLSEQTSTTESSATDQPAHEESKPAVEEKTADQQQSGDGAESIGLRNLREHAKGLETQVKEFGTLVDDFGGKDILLSLKPVAEVFYNPASTVDQRIAALEQVAPGALEEMLWSVAARPASRDALAANLFGASYDQVANAVRDGRSANPGNSAAGNRATDSSQPAIPAIPERDEWGNPIELPEAVRSHFSQIANANRHLQTRLDALESAHSRVTQEAQARAEQQWQHEVRQRESAFLSDLISPAIDVGKQLFASTDKDTPEVRQLKEEAYNTFIQSVPEMVEQVPALKSRAQNALGLLGKRGAEVQAERLKPALKANVGQMAAKRAEFLNRLVNAEIELRALKLQQSQDNTRPEISTATSSGSSATATGGRPNAINPADPFNIEDMLKEVDDRQKSGWFGRFRR